VSRPPIARDKLVRHICSLGNDKNGKPISIRTAELAAACNVLPGSVQAMLADPVAKGEICVCKVTPAEGRACNEYRKGSGAGVSQFQTLNIKRAGIAVSTAGQKPLPGTSSKPQPEVGEKTPAAGNQGPPPVAPAVTATQATPKPTARARMKEEPAAPKASAGDAIRINIDHDGVLIIGTDEGVLELQPEHSKRLGNFMLGSQGIWNPF
jgi:hypothetical protein